MDWPMFATGLIIGYILNKIIEVILGRNGNDG